MCAERLSPRIPPTVRRTRNRPSSPPSRKQKATKNYSKNSTRQYKKWLNEDVVYIISPEERSAFVHLQTNEEREQFIEQFWQRRNPDPDSAENTYKEEHYRRIAYTNEHFASGIPGWKTDRGRIYIMWGPPDEIESHPSGGSYDRPSSEGGGTTSTYPFEDWRYRYLEGIGEDVNIEFVDPTMTGEFHLTMDPSEKDALTYVPGAGLTEMESMGLASKTDRFSNTDGTHTAAPIGMRPESQKRIFAIGVERQDPAGAAGEVQRSRSRGHFTSREGPGEVRLPLRLSAHHFGHGSGSHFHPDSHAAVEFCRKRRRGFCNGESVRADYYAQRPSSCRPSRIQFTATFPQLCCSNHSELRRFIKKRCHCGPGLYRLDIVLKDVNSNNVGVVNTRLAVPRFEDDKLSSSSLILADQITRVSAKDIGLGQFVLGDLKVRPKMDGAFLATRSDGRFPSGLQLEGRRKNA